MNNSPADEFLYVHNGLPPENARKHSLILFLVLFIGVAIFLSMLVLFFGFLDEIFAKQSVGINIPDNLRELFLLIFIVVEQVIYISLTSLSVSSLQAWIIKDQIKSKIIPFMLLFIVSSVGAGISAGVLSCFLEFIHEYIVKLDPFFGMKLISVLISFVKGLFIGALAGGIVGFSSGYGTHILFKNLRHGKRWFIYSCVSWIVYCSIGWALAFVVNDIFISSFLGYGLGIFIIVIEHGISFIIYLQFTPQLEFL